MSKGEYPGTKQSVFQRRSGPLDLFLALSRADGLLRPPGVRLGAAVHSSGHPGSDPSNRVDTHATDAE